MHRTLLLLLLLILLLIILLACSISVWYNGIINKLNWTGIYEIYSSWLHAMQQTIATQMHHNVLKCFTYKVVSQSCIRVNLGSFGRFFYRSHECQSFSLRATAT